MEAMEHLREMFASRSDQELRSVLEETRDDLGAAIGILLERPFQNRPRPLSKSFSRVIDLEASPLSPATGAAMSFGQLNIGENDEPERSSKRTAVQQTLDVSEVLASLLAIFPDACPDYVQNCYKEHSVLQGQNIVDFIANKFAEDGYTRVERVGHKRKRQDDEDTENKPNYEAEDRRNPPPNYQSLVRKVLHQEFPFMPVSFIDGVFKKNRCFLATTYPKLIEAERGCDTGVKPLYKKLISRRKTSDSDNSKMGKTWTEAVDELEYARAQARKRQMDAQLEKDAKLAAQLNEKEHEENNMLWECKCCFGDTPFDSMTHCTDLHFFCLDCARLNAETQIGKGQHKLSCMDGSQCKAEFPRREVVRFLDPKTLSALDKLEQESALRVADIPDLVECPFCDYAAICEPIEVDKEFRCQNFDCMTVSCRHCQRKSHVPRTCEEVAKDDVISHRHAVEEAMTQAMVRKCNKCRSPFIKENGCNKMICTKPGCGSMQCYVCSKTIQGYNHFDDKNRGGSSGNCPLFDNTEERHEEEIQKAFKAATEQLKLKNPEVSEKDLKVQVSEEVRKREEARKAQARPYGHHPAPRRGPVAEYVPAVAGVQPLGVRVAAMMPPPIQIHQYNPVGYPAGNYHPPAPQPPAAPAPYRPAPPANRRQHAVLRRVGALSNPPPPPPPPPPPVLQRHSHVNPIPDPVASRVRRAASTAAPAVPQAGGRQRRWR